MIIFTLYREKVVLLNYSCGFFLVFCSCFLWSSDGGVVKFDGYRQAWLPVVLSGAFRSNQSFWRCSSVQPECCGEGESHTAVSPAPSTASSCLTLSKSPAPPPQRHWPSWSWFYILSYDFIVFKLHCKDWLIVSVISNTCNFSTKTRQHVCLEEGTLHYIIQSGKLSRRSNNVLFLFSFPYFSTSGRVTAPLYVKHMERWSGLCLYSCCRQVLIKKWAHSWYRSFIIYPQRTSRFSKCRSDCDRLIQLNSFTL